jgi:NADH pyrophosphatase NudC (nudix superfamily)
MESQHSVSNVSIVAFDRSLENVFVSPTSVNSTVNALNFLHHSKVPINAINRISLGSSNTVLPPLLFLGMKMEHDEHANTAVVGTPVFATQFTDIQEASEVLQTRSLNVMPFRKALALLMPTADSNSDTTSSAVVVGSALFQCRTMLRWIERTRFCSVCGNGPLEQRRGGFLLLCQQCKSEHFPRVEPAVIMLVYDALGDRVVLGRQRVWDHGRYSTLAGFVDAGESAEDAVRREVHEEVGLLLDRVTYFDSQPWPFPHSLMLGFHARAFSFDIAVAGDELEHARWFTRAEVQAVYERQRITRTERTSDDVKQQQTTTTTTTGDGLAFHALPPAFAISNRLIGHWLQSTLTSDGLLRN